ncbi:hypothetical protein HQ586_06480 [Candidatus Bathyarchaeota archaeon]|nr:hypothetical protein [Candidatus Bathyarchaeota archaeon]
MGTHSEFFEFETSGEFDILNLTGRVDEDVRRSDIALVRGVQDMRARWTPFRSLT